MEINYKSNVLPTLIVNDDASNFLYSGDNLTVEDLKSYLTRYKDTQVGMIAYCASFGGGLCYYDTQKFARLFEHGNRSESYFPQRIYNNYKTLNADYLGKVFKILDEFGIKRLASIRMNDGHSSAYGADFDGPFRIKHPDSCLGDGCEVPYYQKCFNYAIDDVRNLQLSIISEILEKFPDIEGIELDFMRSPFFFKQGERGKNIPIMNDFIREIRNILDSVPEHNYLLTVNVPASPEYALSQGLDVSSWAKEDIIDLISAGSYLACPQTPFELWREILPNDFPLFCYINCSQQMGNYLSIENYRAIAANAYKSGASGIYLFNLCCLDELSQMVLRSPNEPIFPVAPSNFNNYLPNIDKSREAVLELGNKDYIKLKNKHFQFYMAEQCSPHYPVGPICFDRKEKESVDIEFNIYEDYELASKISLTFIIAGIASSEKFNFSLNGKTIEDSRIKRTHSHKGRDQRIRPEKIHPYSLFGFKPKINEMKRGENHLTIKKTKTQEIKGVIEFRELELIIKY